MNIFLRIFFHISTDREWKGEIWWKRWKLPICESIDGSKETFSARQNPEILFNEWNETVTASITRHQSVEKSRFFWLTDVSSLKSFWTSSPWSYVGANELGVNGLFHVITVNLFFRKEQKVLALISHRSKCAFIVCFILFQSPNDVFVNTSRGPREYVKQLE